MSDRNTIEEVISLNQCNLITYYHHNTHLYEVLCDLTRIIHANHSIWPAEQKIGTHRPVGLKSTILVRIRGQILNTVSLCVLLICLLNSTSKMNWTHINYSSGKINYNFIEWSLSYKKKNEFPLNDSVLRKVHVHAKWIH